MLSNYARVERLLKAMNIQEIYWKLFLKDKTFIINMDAVFMGFKHISTSQPLQIVHSFSLFKACSFFWMPLLLIFFFFFLPSSFFLLMFYHSQKWYLCNSKSLRGYSYTYACYIFSLLCRNRLPSPNISLHHIIFFLLITFVLTPNIRQFWETCFCL